MVGVSQYYCRAFMLQELLLLLPPQLNSSPYRTAELVHLISAALAYLRSDCNNVPKHMKRSLNDAAPSGGRRLRNTSLGHPILTMRLNDSYSGTDERQQPRLVSQWHPEFFPLAPEAEVFLCDLYRDALFIKM